MRPQGTAAELERRRFRAVELLDRGESREVVARILGISLRTIFRWQAQAKSGSLEATRHPGPSRRLSASDCEELELLLSQGATAHGWPNDLWTGNRVQEVIQRHFAVTYNPHYVCHLLKRYLKWTCQQPQHQAARPDDDDGEIARWVTVEFPRILTEAKARGAYLTFIDETGFLLEPLRRRTFAPSGRTPINKVTDKHGKISTIGAIIIAPQCDSVHLMYHHLPDHENFEGSSVACFVRALHSAFYGPMTIIWDRTCIHWCRAVEEYLAGERELILEPLPANAPKLNPTDGIWGYVKYHRLANFAPTSLSELRDAITLELESLKGRPALLKSFVRHTKLPIVFAP